MAHDSGIRTVVMYHDRDVEVGTVRAGLFDGERVAVMCAGGRGPVRGPGLGPEPEPGMFFWM